MTNENYLKFADKSPEKVLEAVYGDSMENLKPHFSPYKVAEYLGIPVDKDINLDDAGNDIEGKAFVDNKNPKIWINDFLGDNRKKFTLAHEIGHVLWDIVPAIDAVGLSNSFEDHGGTLSFNRDGVGGIREYRANDFAGRLLMPQVVLRRELRKLVKENNSTESAIIVPALAEKFEVSEQAMIVRLKKLKILKTSS